MGLPMNMHVKSMANELNEKTIEFIKRIKTSKGTLTFENIESLISDYKRLGEVSFFEQTRAVLSPTKAVRAPTSKAATSKDEVLGRFEKLQRRSALKVRDFVEEILEKAEGRGVSLPKLAVKDRGLPKLLAHFRTHASEGDLFLVAEVVVAKHSRTH
jgi:hypothetical protein